MFVFCEQKKCSAVSVWQTSAECRPTLPHAYCKTKLTALLLLFCLRVFLFLNTATVVLILHTLPHIPFKHSPCEPTLWVYQIQLKSRINIVNVTKYDKHINVCPVYKSSVFFILADTVNQFWGCYSLVVALPLSYTYCFTFFCPRAVIFFFLMNHTNYWNPLCTKNLHLYLSWILKY